MATVPTAATLDRLFASIDTTIGQLSDVYAKAFTSWAPESTRNAWLGALRQASDKLQELSIEGQLGQRLAMGDFNPEAWKSIAEAQADLIDYVGREVGSASYSASRFWREVVVQSTSDAADLAVDAGKKIGVWWPYAAVGVVALLILTRR